MHCKGQITYQFRKVMIDNLLSGLLIKHNAYELLSAAVGGCRLKKLKLYRDRDKLNWDIL